MMRKLQQKPRAVPCPIPRPPSQPHKSESSVLELKRMLLNSSKSSLVSNNSSTATTSAPESGHHHPQQQSTATSANMRSQPASSVNNNRASNQDFEQCDSTGTLDFLDDLPPPPEEFLEDIRAVKKQEEIEGPLDDPFLRLPPSSPLSSAERAGQQDVGDSVFDLANHFEGVINLSSYNGHGSLNSSFTETASEQSSSEQSASSWSPPASPHPSPLPSPSLASLDSTSTAGYTIPHDSAFALNHHHPHQRPPLHLPQLTTRFPFPPPSSSSSNRSQSVTGQPMPQVAAASKGIVIALTGVTMSMRGHGQAAINSLSSIGGGTLPRSSGPAGKRPPPDYQTAMQRLCLMKSQGKVPLPQSPGGHHGSPGALRPPGAAQQPLQQKQLLKSAHNQVAERNNSSPGGPAINSLRPTSSTNGSSSAERAIVATAEVVVGQPANRQPTEVNHSSHQVYRQHHHNRDVSHHQRRSLSMIECTTAISQPGPQSAVDTVDGARPTTQHRIKSALGGRTRRASTCSVAGDTFNQGGQRQATMVRRKKKVSFSDQVELVSHSADIEEEHLPNPLLERVLGRQYMSANGILNGSNAPPSSPPSSSL